MSAQLTKQEAQILIDNYAETIKQGKPAKGKDGQYVTDQTKWIWFPKSQLEKVLKAFDGMSVPEIEQGIKFYLGVYGQEPVRGEEDMAPYVGLQTLIMVPSYKDGDGFVVDLAVAAQELLTDGDEPIENTGTMCPPTCKSQDDEF